MFGQVEDFARRLIRGHSGGVRRNIGAGFYDTQGFAFVWFAAVAFSMIWPISRGHWDEPETLYSDNSRYIRTRGQKSALVAVHSALRK